MPERTMIFDVIQDEKERQRAFHRVRSYRQEILTALRAMGDFDENEVIEMVLRCYKTTDLTPTEAILLAWSTCKFLFYSGQYSAVSQ